MPAVIDYPQNGRPVAPARFNVRGWLWLEKSHGEVVAVEACSGDQFLGRAWNLQIRPDVTAALGLPREVRTGFDFFADAAIDAAEVDLSIVAVFRDGTKSAPLVTKQIQLTANAATKKPAVSAEAQQATFAPLSDDRATPIEEGARLPPDHLQIRQVGGVWGPLFHSEGRVILDQIARLCDERALPLGTAPRILDFGCGCGRVLTNFLTLPHSGDVWGCDIDAEAIAWNKANLSHIARFSTNPHLPPTEFPTGYFDIVYSVSVFTHLPEELQFAWLCELRRIVREGGIAIVSVHGEHYWQSGSDDVREDVMTKGFAYRTGPVTEGLPDFYMVAYHAEEYVRTRWAWFFEVVEVRKKYIHGLHDAVVLRRRSS